MTASNQIFTEAQRELLTLVLNRIVPAAGQFPGAGDLGVADFIEQTAGQSIGLRRLFIEGLTMIAITAMRSEGSEFSELPNSAQDEILKEVETRNSSFFDTLVRQSYNGYYTSPEVFQLIGYHRKPAHEYKHQPFDESLLEPQWQRQPFWRQV
jgi:hypothetical protein